MIIAYKMTAFCLLIIYQYQNSDILKLNLNLLKYTGILIMYSNEIRG